MLFIREVNVNGKPLENNKTTDYTQDNDQEKNPPVNTDTNQINDMSPVNPAGEDEPPTDYTQDDNDMTIPDDAAPEDNSQDETPTSDDTQNDQPDEGGGENATDYTQDTGDDSQENSEDNTEGDEQPSTDVDSSDNSVQSDDEIRQMEAEIFSNLAPEQMAIKNKELKTRYLELYGSTIDIIERINNISKSDDISKVLEFVSDKLSELRDMVVDYIENVFSTVSYMENAINYNKYLAILSGINKIMEQLSSKQG